MNYSKRRLTRLPTVTLHPNRRICIYIIASQMILKLWHDLMAELYLFWSHGMFMFIPNPEKMDSNCQHSTLQVFGGSIILHRVTALLKFWRVNIILLRLIICNYSCTSCTPSNSYFNTLNPVLLDWCCQIRFTYPTAYLRRKRSHYRIKIVFFYWRWCKVQFAYT